jgi:hypothetical protein
MAANASETPATGTAPPPAEERPYRRSEPPRQPYERRPPYEARQNVDAVPRPVGAGSQSGSSQLGDFAYPQAEPLNQAALRMSSRDRMSWRDDTDAPPSPRVPMSARIVLVAGLAALAVAVVFWIQSRSNPDPYVTRDAPVAAPIPSPPTPGFAPSVAPGSDRRTTAVPPTPSNALDESGERRVPALRRPPSETVPPAVPAVPSLRGSLPGDVTRKTSAAAVAPAAPAKAARRAHVAAAPRPNADVPQGQEPEPATSSEAADEKPATEPSDHGAAATPRGESPPPRPHKVRDKRPAEKDNDATLPPSIE